MIKSALDFGCELEPNYEWNLVCILTSPWIAIAIGIAHTWAIGIA